jgi:hypothetical protein
MISMGTSHLEQKITAASNEGNKNDTNLEREAIPACAGEKDSKKSRQAHFQQNGTNLQLHIL